MTDPLAGMPLAYPDAEGELLGLLELLGVTTVTWLPPNFTPPIIWIQRIGGAPDAANITDYPLMRVSCYAPTRTGAMNLASDCARLVLGHAGRYLPSGVLLDHSSIDFGSGNDPDLDPDDRRITTNFTLGFRRQYHLAQA